MLIHNLLFLNTRLLYPCRLSIQHCNRRLDNHNRHEKKIFKEMYLVHLSNFNKQQSYEYSTKKLSHQKILSRNFFTKFINKYWQEIVFISVSNNISDTYISDLKANGFYKDNHEYKRFLVDFNKNLNIGRIKSSFSTSNIVNLDKSDSIYIEYKWIKGVNLDILQRSYDYVVARSKTWNTKDNISKAYHFLQNNEFPLFAVINYCNQLVIAEPSRQIINNLSLIDKIYLWYDQILDLQRSNRPVYESLFFINPMDASEYKDYIQYKYKQISMENHLNILVSKLDFYYRLSGKNLGSIQFRLVPDLHEVGNLIFKYRYLNHVAFHSLQKYGKDYFQGQPVYIIQPVSVYNKIAQKNQVFNFNSIKNKLIKGNYSEVIFLNYDTVLKSWSKIIDEYKDYSLPKYPQLLVYNLEDYIDTANNKFLLVPSKESFEFIKKESFYKKQRSFNQIIISKFLNFRVLTKRIIWSLTIRQPNTW